MKALRICMSQALAISRREANGRPYRTGRKVSGADADAGTRSLHRLDGFEGIRIGLHPI